MATVQGLYLALLGRPADPINLAYFNLISSNGADLETMAALFEQAEYRERFAGMTAPDIIETIHQSLFSRPVDQALRTFCVREFSAGRQRLEDIAIGFLDGAAGTDLAMLEAKLAAADLFTANLAPGATLAAYSGPAADAIGRDYIASVNAAAPATIDMVEEAFLQLLREHGFAGRNRSLRRLISS